MLLQITVGRIRDDRHREVYLRGLNIDGMAKMPAEPSLTTFDKSEKFWDGDHVSFVGRPFSFEQAHENFALIKSWGFNTLRYIFTWEAIEHEGPGKYDERFINFTIQVLKVAESYGFYIFLDPHQDVWSRFGGGCGAPMWTYYAAGLEPKHFAATKAAIVQNELDDPNEMPKMIWPTNYYRLAAQVMFTLFFAGSHFAPKCIIDGVNIQSFLQTHLLHACMQLYGKVAEAGLFETCVFGVESMNEPNLGLIGFEDITIIPEDQNLRHCSTPTALQSMILGTGRAQTVDFYEFGTLGPKFKNKLLVDPKGVSAWIQDNSMDIHYGWKRSQQWRLGTCVWALHGVWDDRTCQALKPSYFGTHSGNKIDEDYAVNNFFCEYWHLHQRTLAAQLPRSVLFLCQPPTLARPPSRDVIDLLPDRVIYAPHFYDGLTLMLQRWSSVWSVDALGFLRGQYKWPVFALKFGEHAIRNSIRSQLSIIYEEKLKVFGNDIPLLMSETGMPMDMNDRESYTSNNYTPQIKAIDAIADGLERYNMNYAFWGFSTGNTNAKGDSWNREDFSFHSVNGPRALEAYVRPGPNSIVGDLVETRFCLANDSYSLVIDGDNCENGLYTEIFVPGLHYPRDSLHVTVSSGSWQLEDQILKWIHGKGLHRLTITNKRYTCVII